MVSTGIICLPTFMRSVSILDCSADAANRSRQRDARTIKTSAHEIAGHPSFRATSETSVRLAQDGIRLWWAALSASRLELRRARFRAYLPKPCIGRVPTSKIVPCLAEARPRNSERALESGCSVCEHRYPREAWSSSSWRAGDLPAAFGARFIPSAHSPRWCQRNSRRFWTP